MSVSAQWPTRAPIVVEARAEPHACTMSATHSVYSLPCRGKSLPLPAHPGSLAHVFMPTPSTFVVMACSGKFPPIPAHYSDDLKALVEALIKKEPESRPDMQQILELEYVRRHMKAYSQHIARNITKRQLSFERSLTQFNLQVGWVHAPGGA